MNSMSDETKALLEKYIHLHGISIILYTMKVLEAEGCEVEPIGNKGMSIWDAAIKITRDRDGDRSIVSEFSFYNTFIEVLCVDRDDDPLIIDPQIIEDGESIDYISDKIMIIIKGRTTLVLGMLEGKRVEDIYNENPGQFERIRAREVDADDFNGVTF